MPDAVIINAVRSPIGALGGGLSAVRRMTWRLHFTGACPPL